MNKTVCINGRAIGAGHAPYVIAELSGNHNGELARALHLIELAKKAGADAVKIQTYTPDTMTIDCDKPGFMIKGGLWDGQSLYKLYQWAHTPWDWHAALFEKAREVGITLFSSPFDETAVDLLESLGAPAYKIASFEMTDLPLVEKVARTGKPLIISTGMATPDEIRETVDTVRRCGNEQLVLLHCVSAYPSKPEEANLSSIPELARRYEVVSGLSDHTLTNTCAITSVALGAAVIEKHFTDSRQNPGPDSVFSLEQHELEALCRETRIAAQAIGQPKLEPTAGERSSLAFRRSVYVVRDVKKGDLFTPENVRRIRPGYGLPPKYLADILGKTAPCDIERGTPFSRELWERL
jgi:N-acetylneuraminate synthase